MKPFNTTNAAPVGHAWKRSTVSPIGPEVGHADTLEAGTGSRVLLQYEHMAGRRLLRAAVLLDLLRSSGAAAGSTYKPGTVVH